jgi:hypothetical protein
VAPALKCSAESVGAVLTAFLDSNSRQSSTARYLMAHALEPIGQVGAMII